MDEERDPPPRSEPAARSGVPALRGLLVGCVLSLTLWAAIIAAIRALFGWRP